MAARTGYTKEHEWVRAEGDTATVGITTYAAEQLGDVVFVELPEIGRKLRKAEAGAVVESVKAASDVYSPITGEVVETNGALEASPQKVNEAPESDGWLMKLKVADPAELDALMDEAGYRDFVANL